MAILCMAGKIELNEKGHTPSKFNKYEKCQNEINDNGMIVQYRVYSTYLIPKLHRSHHNLSVLRLLFR